MSRWGAGALGRWVTVGFLLAVIQVRSAQAQFSLDSAALRRPSASAPQRPGVPPVVRIGKWATLAGSVFFGISAYNAHQDAESSYDELLDRCRTVDFSCLLDENNTYLDPLSERLYDDSQAADRRAAKSLIASEILFVATAAGFIWDLTHRTEEPENIPFIPRITQTRSETRVAWTFSF
jgi:hypothetical protein